MSSLERRYEPGILPIKKLASTPVPQNKVTSCTLNFSLERDSGKQKPILLGLRISHYGDCRNYNERNLVQNQPMPSDLKMIETVEITADEVRIQ